MNEHLRRHRPVRALRVAYALTKVVPRYLLLILRDRTQRFAADQAAWDRAHTRAACEIRDVAHALAGAFNKVAQFMGARADVFPAPFVEILRPFQDAVPPRPIAQLRPLIEADLGQPLEAVFSELDDHALGAASLAQVHRARLHDGREVAVKVQYPEVRHLMPTDLGTIRAVARMVHALQPYIDLRTFVEEVTSNIARELDFEREIASTERMAKTLADVPGVRIPAVHRDACGRSVIVLEYLEGIRISDIGALRAAGVRLPDLARRVGDLYGLMIFERDFFHADPHPGNLLVLPDGRIGLLDFGLCKALPKGFAAQLAEMMVSAMLGDSAAANQAAERLGFDIAQLKAEHLRTLMLMAVGDRDGDQSFFEIIASARIRKIPDDFALVMRTMLLLNGLSHRLVPHRSLIQAELLRHLARGAAGHRAAA